MFLQQLQCCSGPFFMGRFKCTLHGSADQVSTVPPLDLPQAQLPGKTFTIKCETRLLLPRESWRRGCWLRTTTVWNFFAVCHTRRKMKADVGTGGWGGQGEKEREGGRKQSANAALSDKKYCRSESTALSVGENMPPHLMDTSRDINILIGWLEPWREDPVFSAGSPLMLYYSTNVITIWEGQRARCFTLSMNKNDQSEHTVIPTRSCVLFHLLLSSSSLFLK